MLNILIHFNILQKISQTVEAIREISVLYYLSVSPLSCLMIWFAPVAATKVATLFMAHSHSPDVLSLRHPESACRSFLLSHVSHNHDCRQCDADRQQPINDIIHILTPRKHSVILIARGGLPSPLSSCVLFGNVNQCFDEA